MMMLEEDVKELSHFIARNIATKLKVSDPDYKSTPELIEDIQRIDPKTYEIFEVFLTAYYEWSNFHKRIEKKGKAGKLSHSEMKELTELIEARDTTRSALIQKVNELP